MDVGGGGGGGGGGVASVTFRFLITSYFTYF